MPSVNDVAGHPALHKMQTWLGWLIALLLAAALLASIDPHWYWPGLVISFTGLLLQLWVLGSIRSRKLLPVNGPYRFVRNPKYIAQFVLVFGLVVMTGKPWLLLIYTVLYVLYALYRVGKEEQQLEDRFSTEYFRYARHVPRFLPRLKPYEKGRFWFFSMKNFKRLYGEIYLLLFVVLYLAGYVAAFHLRFEIAGLSAL